MHTQTHTNTPKQIKYPNTHTATYSNISFSEIKNSTYLDDVLVILDVA